MKTSGDRKKPLLYNGMVLSWDANAVLGLNCQWFDPRHQPLALFGKK